MGNLVAVTDERLADEHAVDLAHKQPPFVGRLIKTVLRMPREYTVPRRFSNGVQRATARSAAAKWLATVRSALVPGIDPRRLSRRSNARGGSSTLRARRHRASRRSRGSTSAAPPRLPQLHACARRANRESGRGSRDRCRPPPSARANRAGAAPQAEAGPDPAHRRSRGHTGRRCGRGRRLAHGFQKVDLPASLARRARRCGRAPRRRKADRPKGELRHPRPSRPRSTPRARAAALALRPPAWRLQRAVRTSSTMPRLVFWPTAARVAVDGVEDAFADAERGTASAGAAASALRSKSLHGHAVARGVDAAHCRASAPRARPGRRSASPRRHWQDARYRDCATATSCADGLDAGTQQVSGEEVLDQRRAISTPHTLCRPFHAGMLLTSSTSRRPLRRRGSGPRRQ